MNDHQTQKQHPSFSNPTLSYAGTLFESMSKVERCPNLYIENSAHCKTSAKEMLVITSSTMLNIEYEVAQGQNHHKNSA
jgi:hypothetical protein